MNILLRVFLIYLVLMGLIYMIPFPYRMTKEGFNTITGMINGLELNTLTESTSTNDQTLFAAANPGSAANPGQATQGEVCHSTVTDQTPLDKICAPDLFCVSVYDTHFQCLRDQYISY